MGYSLGTVNIGEANAEIDLAVIKGLDQPSQAWFCTFHINIDHLAGYTAFHQLTRRIFP